MITRLGVRLEFIYSTCVFFFFVCVCVFLLVLHEEILTGTAFEL